jgi:hypothetical protein
MIASRLSPARLNSTTEQKLHTLEARFGCWIVAYEQQAQLANLSPEDHARVQKLEHDLGISLVAYDPLSRYQLAKPSPQQLERINTVERDLGLVLVAYHHEQTPQQFPATTTPGQKLAKLADDQYDSLHQIEEETGLVLMAYTH